MGLKRWLIALWLGAPCACTKKEPPPPPPPSPKVEVAGQPAGGAAAPAAPSEAPAPAKPAELPVQDPDDSPLLWTIHSGDGQSKLKQKPTAQGKCYLECSGPNGQGWAATGACFGEKSDRKFLANDCVRTVVMIPAPDRAKSWRQVQVMRVYKKDKLDYPVVGVAALPDERLIKGSRSWLKGCYGVPGEPPQYSADGSAVEYESIDGKKRSVPLVAQQ